MLVHSRTRLDTLNVTLISNLSEKKEIKHCVCRGISTSSLPLVRAQRRACRFLAGQPRFEEGKAEEGGGE